MAEENIGPGDTVRLKSGGPLMTVSKVSNTTSGVRSAWCEWFINNKLEKGVFSLSSLDKE